MCEDFDCGKCYHFTLWLYEYPTCSDVNWMPCLVVVELQSLGELPDVW